MDEQIDSHAHTHDSANKADMRWKLIMRNNAILHYESKKHATRPSFITLVVFNRFSKFFYCCTYNYTGYKTLAVFYNTP